MSEEEKNLDNLSVDELKEYIAILLNRIVTLERSRDHYERIVNNISK
jgi:uncharacterized small protein (DUF1192 family)